MLGLPLGLLYANAAEWVIHKHILHGLGKKRSSFWNFHWGEHHYNSRKLGFRDPDYERSPIGNHAQGKEFLAVGLAVAAHLPLAANAPWFTAAVAYSGVNYLYKHRKSHLDPEWAREHLTSHYDHHMGKNQDANWCVTRPWFDWVMGTREPYAFTDVERDDLDRKARREARKAAAAQSPPAAAQASPSTTDDEKSAA